MMSKLIFLVLTVAIATVYANDVNFSDCGNGEVKRVQISGCDKSNCIIHVGSDVTIEADFVANSDANKVSYTLSALLNDFEVSLLNGDACLGMHCPLVNGHTYHYKQSQHMPDVPPTKATIIAKFTSGSQLLACVKTDVEVQ